MMYQPQRPMFGAPQAPMGAQQGQMPPRQPMAAPPPMGGAMPGQGDPMAQLMANPMVLAMLMQRHKAQPFNPAQVRPQEQQVNAVNAAMGTSDPMAQGAAQSGAAPGFWRSLFGK